MQYIKNLTNQIIVRIEGVQISFLQVITWLFFIGISRYLFEQIFFFRDYLQRVRFHDGVYFVLFYIVVFLYSSILIKIFSGQSLKKVVNASVFILPLLFIIPAVDYFFAAVPKPYKFIDYNLSLIECISQYPGITLVGLYMMFLGSVYVTVKKNLFRGVLTFVSLFIIYYYLLASRLVEDFIGVILSYNIPKILPEELLQNISQVSFNLINVFVIIVLLIPFCYFYNPLFFKMILKRFRWERVIQYLLILFFSFSMVGDLHSIRIFIFVFNCIGIYLIWLGSVLVNDYYDLEIDKLNRVTRNIWLPLIKNEVITGVAILWGLALVIASQISSLVFFMYLAVIILTYLYSAPPVRFKQYIFSSFFIGFCAFYVVLIGVFSNINSYYYSDKVLYVAVLFGLTLAAGANVIDLKDYVGDKMKNIKSFVTVFGVKKSKIIIAMITGLSYILIGIALVKIMKTQLYYVAILPAVVMPYMIMRFKNTKKWWIAFFLFHIITLLNGALINIFYANYHLIFKF